MLERLTDETFDTVIQSSTPVLVTFTAPTRCPRCVEQKPVLEQLAREGVPVFLVDVEQLDSRGIESRLGQRGVPFHKIYAGGERRHEKLGLSDLATLRAAYQKGLERPNPMSLHRILQAFGR